MNWAQGQRLKNGKYIIEEMCGDGGFGIVYKARHGAVEYDDFVVIKTPNEQVKSDSNYAKYVDRFIKEGETLAQLSNDPHPHIVRIREFFREGDTYCLVMDFILGKNLWDLVQLKGKLPETEAVKYIRQIGSALIVVHQKNRMHLDVTPSNIMVQDNGKAVLIDFGIAADMSPPSTLSRAFGNQAFAPYELRQGKRHPTVDIYSLAASLYYAVTGKSPTPSFDRKWYRTKLKAPKQEEPSISKGLNKAILRGMALEARNRPQSVRKWLHLLDISKKESKTLLLLKQISSFLKGLWNQEIQRQFINGLIAFVVISLLILTGNKIYSFLSLAGAALWTSIVSSEIIKTIAVWAGLAGLFFLLSLIPLIGELFYSLTFLVLGLYILMPPIAWFLGASLPGFWGSTISLAFFGCLISGAACAIRGSIFFRD